MKAKIVYLLLFLILTFFTYKIYAQDAGLTSIMSQNEIRTCLAADPTITETRRNCRNRNNSDEGKDSNDDCEPVTLGSATKMHLTGTCEAPNGCKILYENSARAVSGIEAGSRIVVNHVAAGPVDVTITGDFPSHVAHKFYAIGDAPIVVTETGLGGEGVEAENQTQQIGEVSNFEFQEQEVAGSQKSCAGIFWDPFGRVFDAVSLEPISGVNVSLFQDPSKQLVSVPNNPALTDKRGVYNILINTENDYYLSVASPATHSFIKEVELNPNYNKVYSHIYTPGEIFHEGPLPLSIPEDFDFGPYHHDIPLQPKGEPYHGAVVEVVEESLNQVDLGDFVNYQGQVTYPLAQVCLVGETSGLISCVNADKYGNFNINVDKLSVPQEFLEIKVDKVDLTLLTQKPVLDRIMSFLVKEVKAQSSITINPPTPTPKPVGFDPILSYIKGYAYGEEGILPSAKITIKLKANNEVFYQTTADETGFFTIYSDNLPFFEYYLDITSPNGKTVKQTTTEFITLNKDYLTEQGLDLIKSTQGGSSIVNPTTGQLNEKSLLKNQAKANQTTPIPAKTSFNPAIITLLIVLFLLVAITVGLALYIKKSKSF